MFVLTTNSMPPQNRIVILPLFFCRCEIICNLKSTFNAGERVSAGVAKGMTTNCAAVSALPRFTANLRAADRAVPFSHNGRVALLMVDILLRMLPAERPSLGSQARDWTLADRALDVARQ